MSFSEKIKLEVKQKANFTCCYCNDRMRKVEVHHIIPVAQGGPDTIENAAPLCSSCHTDYGGNPDLRKEIRIRRDQWYRTCSKYLNPEFGWPIGMDVPLLNFYKAIPHRMGLPSEGIQFTDKDPNDKLNPPVLYLSVFFKTTNLFGAFSGNEKWLYLEANMRFAFKLHIQVRAYNDWEIDETMRFLLQGGYENESPFPLDPNKGVAL